MAHLSISCFFFPFARRSIHTFSRHILLERTQFVVTWHVRLNLSALSTTLFAIDFEAVQCGRERATNRFVTHRAHRLDRLFCARFNRWVVPQGSLERFLVATELIRAFLDGEATVVIKDIGISARAILSVDDDVRLDIVSISLVLAERIEGSWTAVGDVCRTWLHLLRRSMPNGKATIIIGDVLISVVAALTETFLKAVTFVD